MPRILLLLFLAATPQLHISPDALRGDVSFLASDLLEGRDTPSRGLDIAAEFIASQFRAAGLKPILQTDEEHKASNVIAILQGSDPELSKTYVIVSSHYDHLGKNENGSIYRGANDDASGTSSVIEIARVLSGAKPKRSIVFMTFFGEEKGLWGSRYYVEHPVVPLEKTIADLNLEQTGRTDAPGGPLIRKAQVTGFTYSDIGVTLEAAGKQTGITVLDDKRTDTFERSDNYSFARHGIPAHTIGVAWEYPDYHAVTDEWPKLDYENMARVDEMIATATLMLANNPVAPKWLRRVSPPEELPAASDPKSEISPPNPPAPRSKE